MIPLQNHRTVRGYSLIEVLVALLILSVGLLAMANMQLVSLRSSTGSYLRSQAALKAADMSDRIHSNYIQALAGSYTIAAGSVPANPSPTDCSNTTACTPAQLAAEDLYQWYTQSTAALPGFKGSIACTPAACGPGAVVTITVMWAESGQNNVTGTGCSTNYAVDLYCYRLSIAP